MMRLLVLTLCCLPSLAMAQSPLGGDITPVSYTHLTLPTTPYV